LPVQAYHTHDHVCRVCGEAFKGPWQQRTCGVCRVEKKTKPILPTGTVGAIKELRVSVDLMSKGFHVFRALSPSCPCDLFAIKDGKQFDIEVRSARRNPKTGMLYSHRENIRARYKAFVTDDEIIYEPEFK
jgi:hypothetical protein